MHPQRLLVALYLKGRAMVVGRIGLLFRPAECMRVSADSKGMEDKLTWL